VKPPRSAAAISSVLAPRRSLTTWRPASVTDSTIRLPSSGSLSRASRPRASRAASVAPMDCGLILSCFARSLEVAGPPRSSSDSAVFSAGVSSPGACVCFSFRMTMPTATRSAAATSLTSGTVPA